MKINIQNNRLFMSVLSLMLMVCLMTSMLIIPASAAEVTETFHTCDLIPVESFIEALKVNFYPDLSEVKLSSYIYRVINNYGEQIALYSNDDFTVVVVPADFKTVLESYAATIAEGITFYECSEGFVIEGDFTSLGLTWDGGTDAEISYTVPDPPKLSGIVTSDLMTGTFDEIIELLPVVIVVIVGYIGLRKALSFIQGTLHSA